MHAATVIHQLSQSGQEFLDEGSFTRDEVMPTAMLVMVCQPRTWRNGESGQEPVTETRVYAFRHVLGVAVEGWPCRNGIRKGERLTVAEVSLSQVWLRTCQELRGRAGFCSRKTWDSPSMSSEIMHAAKLTSRRRSSSPSRVLGYTYLTRA